MSSKEKTSYANKNVKCKLKQCLNNEKGTCHLSFPFAKRLTANSIHCVFYDDDFEKSWEEYKAQGGTQGALRRMRGRRSTKELKEIKKAKRKLRSDKGQPRQSKKKKGETTLGELM